MKNLEFKRELWIIFLIILHPYGVYQVNGNLFSTNI